MDFVIFIMSIGALILGADFIVNQSENLALKFNISKLAIGATVIAFGTSFPEMVATVVANFNDKGEIAVSNVIGSNIFNITFVLAIVFIIPKKIIVTKEYFIKDAIWVLLSVFLFILMSIDGEIGKLDSILLLILLSVYIASLLHEPYGLNRKVAKRLERNQNFSWIKTVILLSSGFFLVIFGANFAVESASTIAHSFGMSDWVVGIILISFGTSLPEIAISISAIFKKKIDMAIGNIIGSNLANGTIVLGSAGLIQNIPISLSSNIFDILTMLVATIVLVWITVNRLYNKSMGVTLLLLLTLFLSETLDKIGGQ